MKLLHHFFPGRKLAGSARQSRGFAIAPILYLLGLIGVGAGVLFSGYSQILRTNQNMSNTLAAKNDLQGSATTLAASSWLSKDQTRLCPPIIGSGIPGPPSPQCSTAVGAITVGTSFAHASAANLPAGYALAGASGSPVEVGVFAAGAGVKVIDPWGHYYVYCRWENPIGTALALKVISAGPSGKLQTQCGDDQAKGDNLFVAWTTAVTQNHAAVWQTITSGSSITGVQFGATGSQINIDTNGNVSIPGTLGVTGATSLGSAGLAVGGPSMLAGGIVSTTGVFNDGITSTSGSFSSNVSASGGAFSGTLTAGTSTLSSLSVTNDASVGGNTSLTGYLTTGSYVAIGTTVAASGKAAPLLTLGKPIANIAPFTVDQYGDTAATGSLSVGGTSSLGALNATGVATFGDQLTANGAAVFNSTFEAKNNATFDSNLSANGSATFGGTLAVSGSAAFSGPMTGVNGNFTGTLSAANFSGTMAIGNGGGGGGGVTLTGVIPIANGGTGQTTAASALTGLFTLAGPQSGMIPGADLVDNSVGAQQLVPTGVSAGTYNQVTVTSDGRVTWGGFSPSVSDGNGDSINVGTSGDAFMLDNQEIGNWTSTGLMIGSSAPALDRLDVSGATAIGTGYAGITAAPVNGLIVQGQVAIGTSTANGALNVNGTLYATSFVGDGYNITNLNPNAVNGIISPSNGGTGTNTVFTTGSVVYSGASGVYAQDNPNFFWNDTSHSLGIGTNVLSSNFGLNGNAAIGTYASGSAPANGLIVSGKVGLGTSTPANALDVNGAAAIGSYAGFAGPTNGLIVSGGVGIGTANPLGTLAVYSGTNQNFSVHGAKDFASGSSLSSTTDAGTAYAPLQVDATTLELDASNVGLGTATIANSFDVNGNASIGYTNTVAPAKGLIVSGSVGIGTANPQSKLHIFNGEIQVGSSGFSCNSLSNAGAIRYASGDLYFCDNTNTWEQIDSSGADNGGDYMTATQSVSPTAGQGMYGGSPIYGALISGSGTTSDVTLENKNGTVGFELLDGTTTVYMPGTVGIGTNLPGATFTVGNNAFEVASSGTTTTAGTITANGSGSFGILSTAAPLVGYNGNGFNGYSDAGVTKTLQLSDATNAATYFNTGGKVGIGTASPLYQLSVETDQNAATVLGLTNTSSGAAAQSAMNFYNGSGNGGQVGLEGSSWGGISGWANQFAVSSTSSAGGLILRHAAGNLSFYNSSTTAPEAVITSTGSVGIGTTAPAGTFAVNGNAAIGSYAANGIAGPTNGLIVSGNVGIGTASPLDAFELYAIGAEYADIMGGPNSQAGIHFEDTSNGVDWSVYKSDIGGHTRDLLFSNPTTGGTLSLSQAAGGLSVSSYTSITPPTGGMIVPGYVGLGTSAPHYPLDVRAAANQHVVVVANANGNDATSVGLDSVDDSGATQKPFTFLGSRFNFIDGNVGIGTTNPLYTLDVYSSGHFSGNLTVDGVLTNNGGETFNGALHIQDNSASALEVSNANGTSDVLNISGNNTVITTAPSIRSDGNNLVLNAATGAYGLYLNNDVTANTYIMNGNVGIGTTGPKALLTVGNNSPALLDANEKFQIANASGTAGYGTIRTAGNTFYFGNQDTGSGTFAGSYTGTNFALRTSGSDRVTILSGGNVGIGTNVPSNKFDVSGNAAIGSGYVGVTSAPANGLLVQGNVGIGTNVPSNKVDVSGNMSIGAGYVGVTTAPTNGLLVQGNVGIGTSTPNAELTISGAGQTTPNFVTSANMPATVDVDDTGTSAGNGGALVFSAANQAWKFAAIKGLVTNGGGNSQGDLVFSTRPAAGNASLTEDMRLVSNGRLGIGTSAPSNLVDVSGGMAIGAGYVGVTTAPANGLLVQGAIGVGTNAPQSMVHLLNGEVQVGSSGLACTTASNAGAIRYNNGDLFFCDNTNTWKQIDSSGADNGGDYMTATQTVAPTTGQGMYGGSATYGAVVDGLGSTSDVMLGNRSGTPAFEILSNSTNVYMPGKVGINTTTAASMLSVNGNLGVGSYAGTTAAPANGIAVSGSVGIGTTNPLQALEVTGNGRFDGGALYLSNGTSDVIYYGSAGVAAPGANSVGEKIQLYGTAGTVSAGDYAIGIQGSTMWFNTGSAYQWYNSSTSEMYLSASGYLGLNNTNPAERLEVSGNVLIDNNDVLKWDNASGVSESVLWLDSGNALRLENAAGTVYINPDTGTNTYINSNNTAPVQVGDGTHATNFYVADGSVGVNTASPGETLDVNGIIRSNNEIISTIGGGNYGGFRAIGGNYGYMIRNDGGSTYMLLTASGSPYGSWNSLRPITINDATGALSFDGTGAGSSFMGSVGIGTTSPATTLDVQVVSGTTGHIAFRNLSGVGQILGMSGGATSYQPLDVDGSTLLLNSSSGGNVGVNTSTMTTNFNVGGSTYGTGNIVANGCMAATNGGGYNCNGYQLYVNGTSDFTGAATFSGSVTDTGLFYAEGGLEFPENSWMYAPGGVGRNWYIGPADMYYELGGNGSFHFRNSSDTDIASISYTGNISTSGDYLYMAGGTGAVNTTGGPLYYMDTTNTVIKTGSGNGSLYLQNYAGTNGVTIPYSGSGMTFASANPSLTTAGSYFTIPYGIYASGGTSYFQTQTQFRGGIHNDSASYLELDGGTSGVTYINGSMGIAKSSPSYALDVNGTIQGNNGSNHGVIGIGPSSGSSYYGGYFASGSYSAGIGRADGYSFVGTGTLYSNGSITQVGGATSTFSGPVTVAGLITANGGLTSTTGGNSVTGVSSGSGVYGVIAQDSNSNGYALLGQNTANGYYCQLGTPSYSIYCNSSAYIAGNLTVAGTTTLSGTLLVGNVEQLYGTYIWPGRNDGSNANYQTSWYLGSNGSYGLYTNTGMYFAGGIWSSIFYDNANTGYYVQPSQTSVLNSVQANVYYDHANTGYYMQPHATSVVNQINGNSFYDNANTGYYLIPHSGSRLQSAYFDGTLINWSGYNGITQAYGNYIWPGRNDGSGANWQQSWYLASNSSYGLYSNTGLYLSGNLVLSGGGQVGTDGNLYMAWAGTWLSNWVNQNLTTGASPTFGGLTVNGTLNITGGNVLYFGSYGGGWYMTDGTWIRSYGSKNVYVNAGFDTGGASGIACGGALGGGYTFRVCGSEWVESTLYISADTYSNNYYHNSDRRLKDNIKSIDGLATIDKLNGVTFTWKKDGTASAGLIAQDVQAVMPEAVSTSKQTGMLAVSYDAIIAPLVEAVKQLHTMLVALESKVDRMVAEVKGHDDRIAKLEATLEKLQAANDNSAKEVAALRQQVQTLKSSAHHQEIKFMKPETKAESARP